MNEERAKSYKPTEAIANQARQGLEWRREYGRGGTEVGVARARDLSNRKDLPLDTVKRMLAYFTRHRVDLDAPANKDPDADGYPGAGLIAWKLWGGDPGYRWALAIVEEAKDGRSSNMPHPEIDRLVLAETRRVNGREVEFRTVTVGDLYVEESTDDEDDMPMRFRGYAAVFDSPSEPLPFIETIRPGAFTRSLNSGREVRMFLNHNSDQVLGSTRSGTLQLTEDERGLLVEAQLPPTTAGRDLSILMQRGDVHSMSFGFAVPTDGDSWSQDRSSRELREVILHEVSVVSGFPAYPDTAGATVRNIDDEAPCETEERSDEQVDEPSGMPTELAARYLTLRSKR